MDYIPTPVPQDPNQLPTFLNTELQNIANAQHSSNSTLGIDAVNVAPVKPYKGQIAYADGTNWNPGNGGGLYQYDGTTWNVCLTPNNTATLTNKTLTNPTVTTGTFTSPVITTGTLTNPTVTTGTFTSPVITTGTLTNPTLTDPVISTITNGAATLTLPTTTSTILSSTSSQSQLPVNIAGNGPAFSAYASASQTITTATPTKVSINTKIFDTNTNFDTTTNRFTPTVAGYYQVSGILRGTAVSALSQIHVEIYKNGVVYCIGGNLFLVAGNPHATISELVYLNGSTDYIELWGVVVGTTTSFLYSSIQATSRFSAFLARSA